MFSRLIILPLLLLPVVLTGCGGTSDSKSEIDDAMTKSLSLKSDLEDAEFCVDKNGNDACDAGEPVSVEKDGLYEFADFIPDTTYNILAKNLGSETQPDYGSLNGMTYPVNVKTSVVANAETAYVSPASTLQLTQAVSETQLLEVLNQADLSSHIGKQLTSADFASDALDEVVAKQPSEITDADLAAIRAQLVLFGTLRIMQGSSIISGLTGDQFMQSAMNTTESDGDPSNKVFTILNHLTTNVSQAIDKDSLNTFAGNLPAFVAASYPIKMDVIVDTGTAIVSFLAEKGYSTCNATNGDADAIASTVSSYQGQIAQVASEMGQDFYQAKNSDMSAAYKQGMISQIGSKGFDCASGYFSIEESTASTLESVCIGS